MKRSHHGLASGETENRIGNIASQAILGGLHHGYVRI